VKAEGVRKKEREGMGGAGKGGKLKKRGNT
jgi:hypothetical protein